MAEYLYTSHKGKSILKHRKVWIDKYGAIPSDCIIHHIDGNKFNNKIENLECLTRAIHRYQHPESGVQPNKQKGETIK